MTNSARQKNGSEESVGRTSECLRGRKAEKWQTFWCCRGQQKTCKMAWASAEKLVHTGPRDDLGVTKRAVGKNAKPHLLKQKPQTDASIQMTRSCDGSESRWARTTPW